MESFNISPDSKSHQEWTWLVGVNLRAGHVPEKNPGSRVLAKVSCLGLLGDLGLHLLHACLDGHQPSFKDSKALELLLEEKPHGMLYR